jgi:hypothetical protein
MNLLKLLYCKSKNETSNSATLIFLPKLKFVSLELGVKMLLLN